MGSTHGKYHIETDTAQAQASAWPSATSSQKQSKESPMTVIMSTYEVSPRFVFFGESGHWARFRHWARFGHWILVDWSEGLCLSTRKMIFQFRENLCLQRRETRSGYLRQKKERYVSIGRTWGPLMETKDSKGGRTS